MTLLVNEPESVDTEPFHCSKATRYGPVAHQPHDIVHRFGHQGNKVPECIVGRCRLRDLIVRFWFDGMYKIGKFYGVLDEKDRCVIPYQVIYTFLGVKLHGKPPDIPWHIGRTSGARYR